MDCRTQAWASAQATADSAWACMAARAECRRKVCVVAPQHVEPLKPLEPVVGAPGTAGLHSVGLDHEGPNCVNVAR